MHQQCRKTWKASSFVAPVLESHHQVLDCDDEARLHRWIRNCRWSSFWQSGCQSDRTFEQMRCYFPKIRCSNQWHWEMDQQLIAIASIWVSSFQSIESVIAATFMIASVNKKSSCVYGWRVGAIPLRKKWDAMTEIAHNLNQCTTKWELICIF